MAYLVSPHFLQRPTFDLAPHRAGLEALLERALADGGELRPGVLPVPTWQFLCWLADERGFLLHGTGRTPMERLEPRTANDTGAFGAQRAVYAASDGIWPMFFAVLDRTRTPMSISNAAIRVQSPDGAVGAPLYFFSMTASAREQRPFREGRVHVLARDGFDEEAPRAVGEARVWLHHWASPWPVLPLFSVPVTPEDFPFLDAIRAHDDAELFRRAKEDPDGFPWVD